MNSNGSDGSRLRAVVNAVMNMAPRLKFEKKKLSCKGACDARGRPCFGDVAQPAEVISHGSKPSNTKEGLIIIYPVVVTFTTKI
jgi:hypothetical protein